MKTTASIFFTLMLFLMAQPVIIKCQEKQEECTVVKKTTCGGNSCSAKKEPKENNQADADKKEALPQDGCNPFAACSGCQFIAVLKDYPISQPETSLVKKIIPKNENRCSDFTGDCWNPPEVC